LFWFFLPWSNHINQFILVYTPIQFSDANQDKIRSKQPVDTEELC